MSRRSRSLVACLIVVQLLLPGQSAMATAGDRAASKTFTDVPRAHWAREAISYVAVDHAWMRDLGPDLFMPDEVETRRLFARTLVRAFAGGAAPGVGSPAFSDLDPADPFYRFAAIAVQRGWMGRIGDGFRPFDPVTTRQAHRGLVLALGLNREVRGLSAMTTANGVRLGSRGGFAPLALGMTLGLRYNHADEALDVGPNSSLNRAEVAYSLWRAKRAAGVDAWRLSALSPYRDVTIGALGPSLNRAIRFGLRYVGYPYVWAGEWGTASPVGYCCGPQPVGGFDCSGLMWWVLRRAGGGFDNTAIRGYRGWALPERSSRDMASGGVLRTYREARPGDLLFFDGDRDGVVDHVSLYLGRDWALDASGGYGGTQILWLGDGWYRDHLVGARDITD